MNINSQFIRNAFLFFAAALLFVAVPAPAQTAPASALSVSQSPYVRARVTAAIDNTKLVTLKGNVHPLARAEFDQGAVPDSMPLHRMLLLLKRSVDQESSLLQLLTDQLNTNSPNYHNWLTPEQFGAQFGPADSDIQQVTDWLQTQGFQVARVTKGKLAVEFSGTAGQVRNAFHTSIHNFQVNGETHISNISDPEVPSALAPVVRGLSPLNDFRPKMSHHVVGEFAKSSRTADALRVAPDFSTSGGLFAIGPTDFATIYNVLPLWNTTPTAIDGTGQSIAVIGVSNINLQDIQDFRTLFGLPTGGSANTPVVVIDGDDPGIQTDGSETEADLDVEWSGAVAKGAQIHFVIAADTDVASGFLLAIFHALDNNSDPIMSLSFNDCEPNEGSNNTNLWEFLWEQAAAQGITVTVASGDTGSAGCESQNANPPNPATKGLQVNAFASTPFDVAVGGTDFNDATTQSTYFSSTNNSTTLASALGYIPESTWNESCTNSSFNSITGQSTAEGNCNSTKDSSAVVTVGGSGGNSHCFTLVGTTCSGGYAKPAYQSFLTTANGMPNDSARDLPDVSLFASSGFNKSAYVVCEADAVTGTSCNDSGGSFSFLGVGGTSASTPSFAGIMALVNQKYGRQGNANFVLYKLAQMQFTAGTVCTSVASPPPNANCTFNDVTTGTIAMPCAKGSLNCNPTTGSDTIGVLSGYATTPGYDLATGLGSVNAKNLVTNWAQGVSAFTPTTVTLSLSPTTGITAGATVTVNITVTPSTATGDVALVSTASTGDGVDGFTLGSGGKVVNATTDQLTGGSYAVTARYGGDGTFAPSVSAPITVNVGKATTTAVASVLVSAGSGNFNPFTSGTAPVTLFLEANVNPTGDLLPTGTVNFVDTVNGVSKTVASGVVINQAMEAFTLPGINSFGPGTHSIVANYSGDASFNAIASPAVTFTITGGSPGSFTVSGGAASVTTAAGSSSASGTSTITITPSGGFSAAVSVTCSATVPGVSCSALNIAAGTTTGSLTINVTDPSSSMTAMALPDTQNLWASSSSQRKQGQLNVGGKGWWAVSGTTGLAAAILLFFPGRKRNRVAFGLSLVCILSFTLGCGGGSYGGGGGGGGGGTTPTTTQLTVSGTKVAANGSLTVSAMVTGGTPTGNVQFMVDGSVLGTSVPLTNGSTGNITVTAAQAPAFLQLVGTHSVSAHYLGGGTTAASSSGSLNVTVTGTTSLPITGTAGSASATSTVALTIN